MVLSSGLSFSTMSLRRTFLLCAVFLILGFGLLATGWHGSAGFSGMLPISESSVQLNGQASGGWAIGGLACLVLGIVLFVLSLVSAIAGNPKPSSETKGTAGSVGKS